MNYEKPHQYPSSSAQITNNPSNTPLQPSYPYQSNMNYQQQYVAVPANAGINSNLSPQQVQPIYVANPPNYNPNSYGQQPQRIIIISNNIPAQPNQVKPVTNQVRINVNYSAMCKTTSVRIYCPYCNKYSQSVVEKTFSCVNCMCCCWFGVLPWLIWQLARDKELNCSDATHRCGACGNVIYRYTAC